MRIFVTSFGFLQGVRISVFLFLLCFHIKIVYVCYFSYLTITDVTTTHRAQSQTTSKPTSDVKKYYSAIPLNGHFFV